MRPHVLEALAVLCCLAPTGSSQTPFSGATEPGVPFPLWQETVPGTDPPRRLQEGFSNGLTVSWDGRLLMYVDSGATLWQDAPTQALDEGFVFATFDPAEIDLVSGRPDFTGTIGEPFARFAAIKIQTNPTSFPGNDYPSHTGYTGGPYPYINGTLGELGLLSVNDLSNNMYPVPVSDLPAGAKGHNPFKSTLTGIPDPNGSFLTYRAYVTLQDITTFWNGSLWRGYGQNNNTPFSYYQDGTYPNGEELPQDGFGDKIKRNGICKLSIIVEPLAHKVRGVRVLQKWKPFRVTGTGNWTLPSGMAVPDGLSVPDDSLAQMWADNFEPVLTQDGYLMVAKGSPFLCHGIGQTSRVVFYYNTTPFAESGWQGPWQLHQLFFKNNVVLGGSTIAERYPISRHPFRDYDGEILGDADGNGTLTQAEADQADFEGGYTWLDPDGRFLMYSVYTGGVGDGHPETTLKQDGGGSSNRGQVSIVGSVTGWQMWRIDHEAENPSRHMFTGWDQDSRTTHQRNASFGFTPGFWDVLRGSDGIPLRDDGRLKLQLVNSQRLLYYELDLSPYQERDYGFYLPMTEMLYHLPGVRREVDLTRTPDLSGKGHFAWVEGGQLPCEYFDLPSAINSPSGPPGPGLYFGANKPSDIQPGWTSADTVLDSNGKHWAPLADWKDGKDFMPPDFLRPYTQPFAGRGNERDMDSDACWGRVGQAMLFKQSTKVRVSNAGLPAELNPGTSVSGAEPEWTASLWVHPLQARTANTALFSHNFTLTLKPNGTIEATLQGGGLLRSAAGAAPLNQWTHVALTWEDLTGTGSQARLYVNGAEITGSPLALGYDQLPTNTQDILAGCLNNCATSPNDAVLLLDEVALKNNALIGQDVANLALLPVPVKQWDNTDLPPEPWPPFNNELHARVPTSNPYDGVIAQLGADLFRDVQLSGSKQMSCATCHDPARAFTEDQEVATGSNGQRLLRNTPTIYNQRFQVEQFWDARAADLEDQAADPIFEPTEMNLPNWAALDYYLENDPGANGYNARFAGSPWYADDITETHVRKALATYMRAPTAGIAPADQFNAGSSSALTNSEIRGRALFFGRARCSGCHSGPNLTDGRLWTTGTFLANGDDDGAYEAKASPTTADRARFLGAFKTPSLRELERTGPYFHDGHAETLHEVVAFYNAGGVRQDAGGHGLLQPGHDIVAEEINHELGLSPGEIDDLVDYLEALTARPASGGMVDDGPTGLNTPPTVVIDDVIFGTPPGGGPPTSVKVVAEVTDDVAEGGAADLDPTSVMDWTLEVEVGGVPHHWSEGTVTPITNGYRISLTVANPPTPVNLRVRAADHHGLWSGWTYP